MYRADTSKRVAKLGREWHCNVSVGSLSAHYVLYLTNMECHDELHPHTRALKGRFHRIRRLLRRDRCTNLVVVSRVIHQLHQEKVMYLDVIGTTPDDTLDVLIHQLFAVFDVLM